MHSQSGTYTHPHPHTPSHIPHPQLYTVTGAFTLPTLFIVFVIYFPLASWTYGAGIPSGLFIPCLTIGAIYGRFVATAFQ